MSYAFEEIASGRWVVRSATGARLGEVFGGNGRFQAQTMQGKFVGNAVSKNEAAKMLED